VTEPFVFELNDAGLTLSRGDAILAREPGIALVQRKRLLFGREAFAESRLLPRDTVDRFWQRLSQDPVSLPHDRVRSFADLAYFQVAALVERLGLSGDVLLAVHGGYDAEQLGLVLGVMKPQKLRAVGLVDAAVAAVSVTAGEGRYRHLDLTRHGVVVTDVEVTDSARRLDAKVVADVGLNVLTKAAADAAAAAFLDQTRFDPMLDGGTEQLLHDALGGWLVQLAARPEIDAELSYRGHRYQARLTRRILADPIALALAPLASVAREADTVVVSERIATWPGAVDALPAFHTVPESAVSAACRRHAAVIRGEPPALPLVTALPAGGSGSLIVGVSGAGARQATPVSGALAGASHLLVDDRAYAFDGVRLHLTGEGTVRRSADGAAAAFVGTGSGVTVEPLGAGVRVNGRTIDGPLAVAAGDVVTAGAATCRLIRVDEPAG